MMLRRRRFSGQTVVMLAVSAGVVMVTAALVIDNGTHHRVRAQTQHACDAAALAGMAELVDSKDPDLAREAVSAILAENHYVIGQDGVTAVDAYGYNSDTMSVDDPTSDRYHVKIHRELEQRIMGLIGIKRTGTETMAVAAVISAAPMDVEVPPGLDIGFGSRWGFPDKASVAQMGPQGSHQLGDPFSTVLLDNGDPNTLYQPDGLRYDLIIPTLTPVAGDPYSTYARVELFDPDTINDPAKSSINNPAHVIETPELLVDTNGDKTEPEIGALDEILAAPGGAGKTKPNNFGVRSTQTEFRLYDANDALIATVTYGPQANTPFWYHREDPATDASHAPAHADPAQAQLATDLKWVTPQGFFFDTSDPNHPGPYYVMAQTTAGSSENGFSMRASTHRATGVAFDTLTHGVADGMALGAYARGRTVINYMDIYEASFSIASVPEKTTQIKISNFDTEVAGCDLDFAVTCFDADTGLAYPLLFDMSASNSSHGVVSDADGNQYRLSVTGTRSPNRQWRTDSVPIPDVIAVPVTDANGALVFDANGKIQIAKTLTTFPGGDVSLVYRAGNPGQGDTSGWEVGYNTSEFLVGEQQIMLIR